ncbi:natural cytotoxicity triggering receptor 2-like [Notamacropus eugenii]|uniref:natural cytotoxicity triggering receptor 2-like n=1 Tax=Notamacropus eugenii TaxID=9315 RepID=UPI003B682EE3
MSQQISSFHSSHFPNHSSPHSLLLLLSSQRLRIRQWRIKTNSLLPSLSPGQHEETISHVPFLWTHGGMMGQAAQLLLLPLLLMGSQGQVFQVKYQEGQTLRVNCSYKPQKTEDRWKTWCKLREDGEVCDRIITKKSDSFMLPFMEPRASLKDDTSTGTITITMCSLTVEDSGSYWCGIYDSVNDTIDVLRKVGLKVSPGTISKTTKCSRPTISRPGIETPLTIPLATSRPPHSSIFFNSPVIQVLCGLIVTKVLVFTALVVFLARCTGLGKKRSQSELSQDQNDRK